MNTVPTTSVSENLYIDTFNTYAKKLESFLYRRYGNLERAKDVVQESFMKLWINRSAIDANKIKSYLYQIANNTYINVLKHETVVLKHKKEVTATHTTVAEITPELSDDQEFLNLLHKAIENLTEKQKYIFIMNRMEGLTYVEIADYLEVSVKTVEKHMHHALKNIKANLDTKQIAN